MKYSFLEHPADEKFIASGKNLAEMFIGAANALKEAMYEKIKIKERTEEKIEVSGSDLENLLYNFLEEFLFLLEAKEFALSKIKNLSLDKKNLKIKATVSGDNAKKYNIANPVKAITYSEMKVKKVNKGYKCTVVLDV